MFAHSTNHFFSDIMLTEVQHTPHSADSLHRYNVAVIYWKPNDEMGVALAEALEQLGHRPLPFAWDSAVPAEAEVVLSQGPYGQFMQVPKQLSRLERHRRPFLVHWNDEGLPDLRLPWPAMAGLSAARSWVGRLPQSSSPLLRALGRLPPLAWLRRRMKRYSYLGDYHFAFRRGWLNLLVDSSEIYARLHSAHGLPTLAVPWGAVPSWSAELGLERDIDVLWMGARASRRRGSLLDRVREELRRLNIEMYVADNQEHPFVFGPERTRMLNRAKITLNLTRTWYDDNFLRLSIVMPNRSLVVSEPLLKQAREVVAGQHYVEAPIAKLAETIHHFLIHDGERQAIVDRAADLMQTRLTLANSVARIMSAVSERLPTRAKSTNGPARA
jgi:hypothetical protein